MSSLKSFWPVIAGLFLSQTVAAAPSLVPLDEALVPGSYDNNDTIEIAVAGRFNSTCFRVAGYEQMHGAQNTIVVRQRAVSTNDPCLRMLQPFAQVVTLGVLSEGRYKIVDGFSGTEIGEVRVDPARPETEPRYAAIHEVIVNEKDRSVRLRGEAGDRCSRIDEIRVTYGNGTILIEPLLASTMDCTRSGNQPVITFDRTVMLRSNLTGGQFLQVRSRNGQSISRFVIFD